MICGNNNTYSEDYYIDVMDALDELGVEKWKSWVHEVFTHSDATALVTWAENAEKTGDWDLPESFNNQVQKNNNSALFPTEVRFEERTIMEYLNDYGGNPKLDSQDIQTNVDTDLVFALVYDPKDKKYYHANDVDTAHYGYTIINYKLRKMREDLANELIKELKLTDLPNYQFNDDIGFTNFINTVLIHAQSELMKQSYRKGMTISPKLRNTFVKLACFDELLSNSGFVKINPESRIDMYFGKDRYIFTGEVIDYGKSMFEEHADSADYTSKLVKIILNSIDCETSSGKPTGVKLTFDGFQTAMMEVMEYALSGVNPELWELITDPDKYNLYDIINHYTKGSTSLKQALNSIKKYLYANDVPVTIKEMFNAQAYTTVKAIYIEYRLGSFADKKKFGITAGKAEDKIVDQVKNRLLDKLVTKAEVLINKRENNSGATYEEFRKKLKLKYDPDTQTMSFVPKGGDASVKFKYDSSSGKFIYLENPYENNESIWAHLFRSTLDLPLSNSKECKAIVSSLHGKSIFDYFNQTLAALLWTVEASDTVVDWKKNGTINGGKMYRFVDDGVKFMNNMINSEFKSIVKDQNGNNIPPYQMISLAYRTHYLIRKIRDDFKNGVVNVKKDNLIVENPAVLGETSLRESIEIGGVVKNVADMSAVEALSLAMFTDYYQNLDSGNVRMQPMVYSDKTRHILYELLLSKINLTDGNEAKSLHTLLKTLAHNFINGVNGKEVAKITNLLYEEIRKRRFSEARLTLQSKLNRFVRVYGLSTTMVNDRNEVVEKPLNVLVDEINKLISTKTVNDLANDFRLAKVDFFSENDVNKTDVGTTINPALVNAYNTYSNPETTRQYFERVKIESAIDMMEGGFRINRFLDPSLKHYFDKLGSGKGNWINSNSGEMQLFKIRDYEGNEVKYVSGMTPEDIMAIGTLELNPMINSYFMANALLCEQIRTVQMGSDYSIAGYGNTEIENITSRFIAQSKRAMGQGSTILKFDTTRKFGVGKTARKASIKDLRRRVHNPQGDSKNELINDGCGYMSPEQFILETWSVPGNTKPKGDVVKSIMQFVNSEGSLEQIKWAADVISNLRMRGAEGGDLHLKEMYKLTHSDQINVNFNIQDFYGDSVYTINGRPITCTEPIYYKDNENGTYWRIDSVENTGPNQITRHISMVNETGKALGPKTSEKIIVNSIYDLFELFGGEWCMNMNHRFNSLEYTEMNHEILANIICVNDLKDKFIGYVVNDSAYKVGVNNSNPETTFEKHEYRIARIRKELVDAYIIHPEHMPSYFNDDYNTVYGLSEETILELAKSLALDIHEVWDSIFDLTHTGWQLDAGHEVKDGHVTEMSQLVSLLIEKGYCTDIVADIYNNISKVTEAGLEKFKEKDRLKEIISEILVDSLNSKSNNIVSITDDFIKGLQTKVKDEGLALKLPFSSPSIRNKFATAICASINRAALRRRYAGLGTVQTASVGQMCTMNVGGFDFTYEETCDLYRKSLHDSGLKINDMFVDINSKNPREEVTAEYVSKMLNVKAKIKPYNGNEIEIPVMEEISSSSINFQDTIVIPVTDASGITSYKIVKINDISTRDRYKHVQNLRVFRWNTKSRDLIQQLSYYTTDQGTTYDIYDFDEARLVFYLATPDVWTKWSASEQAFIKDFIKLKTGNDFDFLYQKGLLKAELKNAQKKFQERLNLLSDGDVTIFVDGIQQNVISSNNKGADIMVGNAFGDKFDMSTRDSVAKVLIQGPKFFEEKLKSKQKLNPKDVPEREYDAILYTNDGEKILIQFGDNDRRNHENLFVGNTFTKTVGKLRYKGEDLGDSKGVKEFVYKGGQGNFYKVLRLSDPTKLDELRQSKLFNGVRYSISENTDFEAFCRSRYGKYINDKGIITKRLKIGQFVIEAGSKANRVFEKYRENIILNFKTAQLEDINRRNKNLAERQFIAFKKALECIGTRIPSQALQSCAKCRIIGFTGSRTNDVYVPQTLTWVAGSDYDIDKFFIMMYDIMDDGTLPNTSGITNPYFDPIKLNKLPDGNGTKYDISISLDGKKIGNEVFVTKEQLIAINRGNFEELQSIISQLTPDSELVVLDPEVNGTDQQLVEAIFGVTVLDVNDITDVGYRNEILNFLDTINEWSLSKRSKFAKRYRDAAERNMVVSSISKALSEHSVQIALQNAISMDDAKKAAKQVTVNLNNDNIWSRFKQQEDNMVGKTGISSVAVAQKAFNGISFSFNYIVSELTLEAESLDWSNPEAVEKWQNKLSGILIERKVEKGGGYMSLANINFRKLIKILKARQTDPTLSPESRQNLIVITEFVKDVDKNSNTTDAVNLFSNIMSAATDNAKELLLARLNAIGDNIDIYTYLFATGYTFQEAADKMNSDTFNLVNKFKQKNIFELNSSRITLDNVLKFMSDDSYLPTVNKYLLKSIFNDFNFGKFHNNSFIREVLNKNISEVNQIFIRFINQLTNSNFTNVAEILADMQLQDSLVSKKLQEEVEDGDITYIEKLHLKLLKNETVQELLTGKDGWLTKRIWSANASENGNENDDYGDDHREQVVSSVYKYDHYTSAESDQLRRVYDYLTNKVYLKHLKFDETQSKVLSDLQELKELTKKADEFAILGRKIFSINQGMKVGDYEEWAWIEAINTAINRRFYEKYKNKPVKIYKFDFIRFMTDDIYADFMCEKYNEVKSTVNILNVLRDSPHYVSMINSAITARKLIEESYVAKETRKLSKALLNGITSNEDFSTPLTETIEELGIDIDYVIGSDNNAKLITRSLTSSEFRRVADCVNEHLVLNFFTHLDGISIPLKSTQIPKKYSISDKKLISSTVSADDNMYLNTIDGLATFKVWMDDYFIPKLKTTLSLNGYNAFADFLVQTKIENKTYGTKKFVWNIDRDVKSAQPGEWLYSKKAEVVAAFNVIMQRSVSEILGNEYRDVRLSIGDMLYLYNLYSYKGSSLGMDFLFADAAASGNKSEWVNNFQRYVTQLDAEEIKREGEDSLFDITLQDLIFKVVDKDNAWRFNLKFNGADADIPIKSSKGSINFNKPEFMQNSDVLFEIDAAYNGLGKTNEWTGFDPYEYFTFDSNGKVVNRKVKTTSSEVMHVIIDKLNVVLKSAGISIIEYTNSDLKSTNSLFADFTEEERMSLSNKRGFVYNGKIYINTDPSIKNLSASDPSFPKILVHELVHIIAANLHYNPKYSKNYGQILIRLWNAAGKDVQDEYKEKYPNKRTTDLMEEYFANCIADSFDTKLRNTLREKWNSVVDGVPEIENVTLNQLQYDIHESLKEIFELDESFDSANFSKVLGTDLSQAIGMFNSGLFDFSKSGFTTRVVELSQGLATVKNILFNENKIIEDCK